MDDVDFKFSEIVTSVLVTGGTGLVGTELQKLRPQWRYVGRNHFDLTKYNEVTNMLEENEPRAIIHLAALVGGIQDNVRRPYDYLTQNVQMNTCLIDRAREYGVNQFIGVLSTCAYPDKVHSYPMKEEVLFKGSPAPTNLGYGLSKQLMGLQIEACNRQYGTCYSYVIPCNLYGVNDKFDERGHFLGMLIQKILRAYKNGERHISLLGTGKPLRQFMHAGDLARVLVRTVEAGISNSFNVAPNNHMNINQLAQDVLNIMGVGDFKIHYDRPELDGQYRKDVCTDLFRELFPTFQFTNLQEGVNEILRAQIDANT